MASAAGIPKDYLKYGLLAGLGLGALIEYDNLDIFFNTTASFEFSKTNFSL